MESLKDVCETGLCGFGVGFRVPFIPSEFDLANALIVIVLDAPALGRDEAEAFFHEPSKNMFTALSISSPAASRSFCITSGSTSCPTKLSKVD
jgi:hypothetical protein